MKRKKGFGGEGKGRRKVEINEINSP